MRHHFHKTHTNSMPTASGYDKEAKWEVIVGWCLAGGVPTGVLSRERNWGFKRCRRITLHGFHCKTTQSTHSILTSTNIFWDSSSCKMNSEWNIANKLRLELDKSIPTVYENIWSSTGAGRITHTKVGCKHTRRAITFNKKLQSVLNEEHDGEVTLLPQQRAIKIHQTKRVESTAAIDNHLPTEGE